MYPRREFPRRSTKFDAPAHVTLSFCWPPKHTFLRDLFSIIHSEAFESLYREA